MMWKIIATACMLNAPSDCWTWQSPKPFSSYTECNRVLSNPYAYGYTDGYPMKVEGSAWTAVPTCKPQERK